MKNHTDQDSKKQRILDATLDLIDEYGFEGITTRKIADRANVNVALINYYFGTKDALINQVVKIILSSLKEPFAHLEDRNLQPRERLKQFFLAYLKIYHMYPSIITLLLQKDRIQFESQKEYMNFVQALGIKKLEATLEEITGIHNTEMAMTIISQLIGALIIPQIMERLLKEETPFHLQDLETQIDLLFDHYFYQYQSPRS